MGNGQWPFIYKRIKSCGFYTNMPMQLYMKESKVVDFTQICPWLTKSCKHGNYNKWVMANWQWQFMHERIKSWGLHTNMTTINKRVTCNDNPYIKKSKVEVFTQTQQKLTKPQLITAIHI